MKKYVPCLCRKQETLVGEAFKAEVKQADLEGSNRYNVGGRGAVGGR